MKIIGKTQNGFILDASNDEIALLMGFRRTYDDGFKQLNVGIGTEMNLSKMAATSEFLRNVDKEKLTALKQQLGWVIDAVDEAQDTVQAITLFDTLEHTGKKENAI